MGDVYRARDERLGRDVAVKVLPADVAADPDRLRRFEQEARAAGQLAHPNILVLHDVGSHQGQPFLVTELLEGETLRGCLHRGPLPVRKAIELGAQIAHGLAAAHERRPVVGRICMDQVMVNIEWSEAWNGDEVVLIGEQGEARVTVEELAEWAGTIPYEILTAINARVPRIYEP
jgi:serine/threonine protein kinase